jgi:hypothetical protein
LGDGSMGRGKRREEPRHGLICLASTYSLHAHTHALFLLCSPSRIRHRKDRREEKSWTDLHRSLPTSSMPPAAFNWHPPYKNLKIWFILGLGETVLFFSFLFFLSFYLSFFPSFLSTSFVGLPVRGVGPLLPRGWLCFPHINFALSKSLPACAPSPRVSLTASYRWAAYCLLFHFGLHRFNKKGGVERESYSACRLASGRLRDL